MKIALVFVTLLLAVFVVWYFHHTRTSSSEEELARGLVLHQPSFAVEGIRFPGDGRAVIR